MITKGHLKKVKGGFITHYSLFLSEKEKVAGFKNERYAIALERAKKFGGVAKNTTAYGGAIFFASQEKHQNDLLNKFNHERDNSKVV